MSSYTTTDESKSWEDRMGETSNEEAIELRKHFDILVSERKIYEKTWDDLTEYLAPSQGVYVYRQQKYDPQRKSYRRLDSTPIYTARQLMAKVNAEMTGNSTRWFDWRHPDPEIDKIDEVRRCLFQLSDKAYNTLNNGPFRTAHTEALLNWIIYGTSGLEAWVDGDELNFRAIPTRELYISENKDNIVDVVYRKFHMTYRQACQFFGDEMLSDSIHEHGEQNPFHELEIVHCIKPNEDYDPKKKRNTNFKFQSTYLCLDTNEIIKTGYFKKNPYIVFRFWKRPEENYGGSCAIDCLPDIRILNLMQEAYLRILQRKSEPPLIMAHDSVIMPLKITPNGINYGGLSSDGKRQIMELFEDRGGEEIIQAAMEQKRDQIRTAFFIDPRMGENKSIRTAAEVNKRSSEELVGITPFLARLEIEYLIPVLDFTLDWILENNSGKHKIMIPPELHGSEPKIQFSAPLSQTQRGQELQNLVQLLQMVQNLAQVDPTVVQHIDMNTVFSELVDLLSVNLDIVVPPQIVAAKQAAAAQAQMKQQQLQNIQQSVQAGGQAVGQFGGALSNMAKAGLVGRKDVGLPELEGE